LTTQAPGWANRTVDPLIVQAPLVVAGAIDSVTGSPEAPPVAVTVWLPPTVASTGRSVNVMSWLAKALITDTVLSLLTT
jgi:hypothetical protein